MKLGYLVDTFPSLSETFILREIIALQEQGVEITIMALHAPPQGQPVHSDAMCLLPKVIYPQIPLSTAAINTTVGVVKQLLHLSFPVGLNPHRVAVAKWFADQAAAIGIHHFHAHFATVPTDIAWAAACFRVGTFSFSAHACDVYTQSAFALRRKIEAASFVAACTEDGLRILQSACVGLATRHQEKLLLMRHGLFLDPYVERPVNATPTAPLVVAVGRLEPKKGFDDLLRACSIVVKQQPSLRCCIVGEGSEHQNLQQLLEYLHLEDTVTLTGAQTQEQVQTLLRSATLFVLPSVALPSGDRDGVPNVILEAWACGCPVITTTASAAREVLSDNIHGVLVPPRNPQFLAEAMLGVIADAERQRRLGKAGRQQVEAAFNVRHNVAALHWQFQRLHASRRPETASVAGR